MGQLGCSWQVPVGCAVSVEGLLGPPLVLLQKLVVSFTLAWAVIAVVPLPGHLPFPAGFRLLELHSCSPGSPSCIPDTREE